MWVCRAGPLKTWFPPMVGLSGTDWMRCPLSVVRCPPHWKKPAPGIREKFTDCWTRGKDFIGEILVSTDRESTSQRYANPKHLMVSSFNLWKNDEKGIQGQLLNCAETWYWQWDKKPCYQFDDFWALMLVDGRSGIWCLCTIGKYEGSDLLGWCHHGESIVC